jgi:hypothetical protein
MLGRCLIAPGYSEDIEHFSGVAQVFVAGIIGVFYDCLEGRIFLIQQINFTIKNSRPF